MQWIQFPDNRISVCGLPWFVEEAPSVRRLPTRMKDRIRQPLWNLAQMPAGGRLRFRTDTTALEIRATYPNSAAHGNMSLIGQSGICVYVDGYHWVSQAPGPISDKNAGVFEGKLFSGAPKRMRDVTLYLPNYNAVDIDVIGIDDDAAIEPSDHFVISRPIVFYGSSITQGGCASRSGMSYEAILGRILDVDFVNLGFSGNGLGEPELAEAMAEIDAACYVLDYAVNLPEVDQLHGNYTAFIKTIRAKRPDTPIVAVTPIFATHERWSAEARRRWNGFREIIRAEVGQLVAGGDPIRLIEGYSLFGPDIADGMADAVHPNDVGFTAMATRLAPTIAQVVGLDIER